MIVFIAIKLGISIIGAGIGKVADLPILKQIDQLLGSGIGFIKGFISIFIILAIMVPVMNMMQNDFLVKSLKTAPLTEYCYDHNILLIAVKDYL